MSIETKIQQDPYVPYRFDGNYSRGEILALRDFMNRDFRSIYFKTRNGGSLSIEYPTPNIASPFEWEHIISNVLLPELDIFHPKMLKRKITARFVDSLYDYDKQKYSGGAGLDVGDEYWVRIPYKVEKWECDLIFLAFIFMHEVIERDFWDKTIKTDVEANQICKIEGEYFLNSHTEYRNLLDEKIANRRALKALRRYWFNANWTDPSEIYDEDRSM